MNVDDAKILVVDDEPALREIFAKWLRTVGCGQVNTAFDGEDALESLQSQRVDLLITDVRMPRLDGVGLVRKLGELQQTIPSVIFVSGFGDVDEREMYGLGVEAFLSKPLRLEELTAVIKNALTERNNLWRTPMEVAPRQSMEFAVDSVVVGAGMQENELRLGRGGFSVRYPGPLAPGKVAFRCNLPGALEEVSGQGFVRWRSRADQAVGVEFAFLHESCRERVTKDIIEGRPQSFIPS